MKAVVFETPGSWQQVLCLKELKLTRPSDNEVQIKVTARPINPSDAMFIAGKYRKKPVFPQIAGLEGAGIVTQCGTAMDKSLLGKQVAFRATGTWVEQINLPAGDFTIVPGSISPEVACQLSLNAVTAFALLEESTVEKNDWLLITAASGAVAHQVIQLATAKKIKTIAVVRRDDVREKLIRLGTTAVVNIEREHLLNKINELAPEGVKAAIDAVGGATGSTLYKLVVPFGKIIIYGTLSNEPVQYHNADIIYKNLTVQGFGIDAWLRSKSSSDMQKLWNKIIDAVNTGELIIDFDKRYRLEEFNSAIAEYITTSKKIILSTSI